MKVKHSDIKHALTLTDYDGDVDQIPKEHLMLVLKHEIMHLKAEVVYVPAARQAADLHRSRGTQAEDAQCHRI